MVTIPTLPVTRRDDIVDMIHETGAKAWLLILADLTIVVVLVAFAVTTLVDEPGTALALVLIVLLSVALDLVWKHRRDSTHTSAHRPVPR